MSEIAVTELAPEAQKVIDFRLEWLLASGYRTFNAEKIAAHTEIDWHLASKLRERCDDEELCMRILFGS